MDRSAPSSTLGLPSESIVVVAASAGGLDPLRQLVSNLPAEFPAPLLIVQHLPPSNTYRSRLRELLARTCRLPVKWIEQNEVIRRGTVYLAPQDAEVRVALDRSFHLSELGSERRLRRSADVLFSSVAECFGKSAVGIVLTGCLSDGARGAREIVDVGGRVFVQDRESCLFFDMPQAAMLETGVNFALSPGAMARALVAILMAPGAEAWFRIGQRTPYPPPKLDGEV